MQTLRLDAAQLQDFTASLMDWGTVWAPVETTPGTFTLQALEGASRARPDVLRTAWVPRSALLRCDLSRTPPTMQQ